MAIVLEVGGLAKGPRVFDVYMSPGSVTERVHFYAAPYGISDRTGAGGGVAEDGEDIEVLEVPFATALAMTADGRISDAKTIMLLQWAAAVGVVVDVDGITELAREQDGGALRVVEEDRRAVAAVIGLAALATPAAVSVLEVEGGSAKHVPARGDELDVDNPHLGLRSSARPARSRPTRPR